MNRLIVTGVVAVSMLALSAAPALAAPNAALSPDNGGPGTTVTVSGTGYAAGQSIDVFFDTTDLALATSDSTGAVSIGITIPSSAQPGRHWITLDQRVNHTAAHAQFTVVASWPEFGWGPSGRSWNPVENTINTGNVAQLIPAWSQQVSPYGNPKPFVNYQGSTYVFDEGGVLHAYAPTGQLLWTATPGTFRFSQAAPTDYRGYIYVGDGNGNVAAYANTCRSDGGVCSTQLFSKNIGTGVNGGLTAYNGNIYAPGADGLVHVLNWKTGAAGTSITPFWSGAVTQPVSFGEDGTAYIVQDNAISGGGGGISFVSGTHLSWAAVGNGVGYVTGTDGYLHSSSGWSTTIGPTGCDIPPAFANNVVYAAGCNSVGAYDPNSGAALWSISEASQPSGLAVANGVLYACVGSRLQAYDASYGGLLASLGSCDGHPEVVGGTLYAVEAKLSASTLNGAVTTAAGARTARPPDPRTLRPNLRLHRRGQRHHHLKPVRPAT